MAAYEQHVIQFNGGETSEVEAAMQAITARGDGQGWVNIGPALTEEQLQRLPAPSTVGDWFSSRGPIVPLATWTPAPADSGSGPVTIGIEHGAGPKALERLTDAGLPLPRGWRKVQDHGKRGIVVEVPSTAGHRAVVDWLVSASWALCGVDIDDHWSAVVNTPES